MAKDKTVFVCRICGAQSHRWQGKCFECGEFNSFVETRMQPSSATVISAIGTKVTSPQKLTDIRSDASMRRSSGVISFDHLIGGGFVPGQVLLIGGEPGVGKSTLLIEIGANVPTFYVCGEESELQVKLRADRLGLKSDKLTLLSETNLENLIAHFERFKELPDDQKPVLIVDSIQSIYSTEIKSGAGSIAQVQYCATMLSRYAKSTSTVLILVGQVTKGGYIAGPKQLEHLVDTVMYFEGDKASDLRVLRVEKNRFGSTDQVEIYQMTGTGLEAGDAYLEGLVEDREKSAAGSVLTVVFEGSRPIVIEVQALNSPAQYNAARRIVNGVSVKRVQMILAVLYRRLGIKTDQFDIYVNISGGLKVNDPALDLPMALALISVIKNKPLDRNIVAFGEVGLMGEIKQVPFIEKRMNEARARKYTPITYSPLTKTLVSVSKKLGLS